MLLDLAKEITSMSDSLTQSQNDLAAAKITIDSLTTDKTNMQAQIDKLTADSGVLSSTIEQLKSYPPMTAQQIRAQRIIGVALLFYYMRVPYKYGGNWDPDKKFDCSGYMQISFKVGAGLTLPRVSHDQATIGVEIPFDNLQPGDLIFYDFNHDGVVSHVSLYIGAGKIIQTNNETTNINIQDSTWSKAAIVHIRRAPELQ